MSFINKFCESMLNLEINQDSILIFYIRFKASIAFNVK